MSDIFAMVKSAIQGQATSPIYTNGKATAFKMALNGQSIEDLPWTYFHPVHIKARLAAGADDQNAAGGSGVDHSASWTSASDPLVGLTEALITKVSAMTMIERSEIEPDAPLASHGLDSLVSVELRNWIRRETSVELALTTITQSASLHALASHVILQIPKA
jgi:acyl carrier protein